VRDRIIALRKRAGRRGRCTEDDSDVALAIAAAPKAEDHRPQLEKTRRGPWRSGSRAERALSDALDQAEDPPSRTAQDGEVGEADQANDQVGGLVDDLERAQPLPSSDRIFQK